MAMLPWRCINAVSSDAGMPGKRCASCGRKAAWPSGGRSPPGNASEPVHLPVALPQLSVYGGKVTTYRRLAEEAVRRLSPYLGARVGPAWTASAPLPGGGIADGAFEPFVADLKRRYPAFEPLQLVRLARRHGALIHTVMGDAKVPGDMGEAVFGGLTAREIAYMKSAEWAAHPDDVLWRRTKLGLHALATRTPDQRQAIADRVAAHL